jgi:hypothetical protein
MISNDTVSCKISLSIEIKVLSNKNNSSHGTKSNILPTKIVSVFMNKFVSSRYFNEHTNKLFHFLSRQVQKKILTCDVVEK